MSKFSEEQMVQLGSILKASRSENKNVWRIITPIFAVLANILIGVGLFMLEDLNTRIKTINTSFYDHLTDKQVHYNLKTKVNGAFHEFERRLDNLENKG